MKVNLGKTDRVLRSITGAGAIGAGLIFQSWWGLAGVILLFTGILGWCPLYAALGTNTLENNHPQKA
ncbi:MAG: DUF2892 domain-containing protein [Bacillota bacterium]